MKNNLKVYGWLALLGSALFALSSIAGQRVVVSQLPTPERPLAEVETNVVFSTGTATDNKWTLTIERDAATSNSVEATALRSCLDMTRTRTAYLVSKKGSCRSAGIVGDGSGATDAQMRHAVSRELPSVST